MNENGAVFLPSRYFSPATFLVLLAAVLFGLAPLFARSLIDAGLSPTAIAFFRYGLTTLVLLPVAWRGWRKGRATLWALAAGLAIGMGWIGYVAALEVAPVTTVAVLYMSYPLFALIFGWLLLSARPTRRTALAGGLILAAAALALGPAGLGSDIVVALLLSLTAPLTFGAVIVIITAKLQRLTPLERVFFAALGATAGLAVLMAVGGTEIELSVIAVNWWLIVGIGLATALVPQLLYVLAAPVVGHARTAMGGSFELPTMLAVGWLAFGEPVLIAHLVACVMVIAAIAMTPALPPAGSVDPGVRKGGSTPS